MTQKFTPGAWSLMWHVDGEDANNIFVCAPQNGINFGVCEVFDKEHGDAEANAHLIAAAPDMFEALERAVRLIRMCVGRIEQEQYRETINSFQAALKKARGEI